MRNFVAVNLKKKQIAFAGLIHRNLLATLKHLARGASQHGLVNFGIQNSGKTTAVYPLFLATPIFVRHPVPVVHKTLQSFVVYFLFTQSQLVVQGLFTGRSIFVGPVVWVLRRLALACFGFVFPVFTRPCQHHQNTNAR